EILRPDLGDVPEVLLRDVRERPLEIGEVFLGETNDPAAVAGEFVACPYVRSRHRLGKNLGHRRHSCTAVIMIGPACLHQHTSPLRWTAGMGGWRETAQ